MVDREHLARIAALGGKAKAAAQRARRGDVAPFEGSMLDMMDLADLTGPSWKPWRSFWSAVFALPMDEADLATYRTHTDREQPPARPVKEAYLLVGRRGGKTRSAALAALYLGIRRRWADVLAPGERALIPAIGADKKQAAQCLGFLKGLARMPAFRGYVRRVLKDSVELATGATVEVFAGNFRLTRGYSVCGIVADELSFWRSDESATPDVEVIRALKPGMATVADGVLLGLSTPYAPRGVMHAAHERAYGKPDPRTLVWNASSLAMNPSLDPGVVDEAFLDDPIAAASEYGIDGKVSFRQDVESLVDPAAVAAVVDEGIRERPPQAGVEYRAFVDAASGSGGDSMVMAIAHREGTRAVLDLVRERRPRFVPADVVRDFAEALRAYRLGSLTGDNWAPGWVALAFEAAGVRYLTAGKTKSELYGLLVPAINGRRVLLLDLPSLRGQLVALERRVSRGTGKEIIDHPRGGHDDLSNSACGALLLALPDGGFAKKSVPAVSPGGDRSPNMWAGPPDESAIWPSERGWGGPGGDFGIFGSFPG